MSPRPVPPSSFSISTYPKNRVPKSYSTFEKSRRCEKVLVIAVLSSDSARDREEITKLWGDVLAMVSDGFLEVTSHCINQIQIYEKRQTVPPSGAASALLRPFGAE